MGHSPSGRKESDTTERLSPAQQILTDCLPGAGKLPSDRNKTQPLMTRTLLFWRMGRRWWNAHMNTFVMKRR